MASFDGNETDSFRISTPNDNLTITDGVQIERMVKGISYATVGLFAIVGNFLVIFMVVLSRKLHTITNIFVVNLSLADLVIGMAFPLESLWLLQLDVSLPEWTCTLVGSIIMIAVGCSVSTLFFVAMNRYVLITRSRATYQRIFTPCNIVLMIASTWLNLTGFLIVPQIVGYGNLGYDMHLELCIWDPTHEYDMYYKGGALALLTLPLFLSSICYILIFKYIRNHFQNMASHRQSAPIATNKRIDIIITKNLLVVICAFYICILPFVIAFCATGFSSSPGTYGYVASYLAILLGLNSCLNPLFYCLKHPHFREVFSCIAHCDLARVPLPSAILQRALAQPDRRSDLAHLSSLNTISSP
ncbi:gastrin/cholecystokinin type B receptor-like [Lytechinus variegatus]|uniref:gastrin/cholecystokinin type B receptor-like n=1 Tax=Lytechinus variegatus TaxID=7654 RepID=UPI001BB15511|nr:gastrin/cholecystokinin type B receptor-like [Lytechinus variegatus]